MNRLFSGKTNDKIFQKIQKILFWSHFAQIWAKLKFLEKRTLSVFKESNYLPLLKKSEKTNDPFLREMPN